MSENQAAQLPVSVLIIAQNTASSLKRCLDSLTCFQEVVLVDGGSDDETASIAKSYSNVSYFLNPWPGFIEQRNYSLTCASFQWCLMLDADEALTGEVVNYIEKLFLKGPDKKMYRIVRTEFFEGSAIEYGHGRSDYQERFFLKEHISYCGGVHHGHLIDGQPLLFPHPEVGDFPFNCRILHDQEYGLDEMVKKLPRFSYLIAHEKIRKGKKTNGPLLFVEFFGTFFKTYSKSWRGGRVSFVLCLMKAIHNLLVKLYIYNHHYIKKVQSDENYVKQQRG